MLHLSRAFLWFALLFAPCVRAKPWPAVESDLPADPVVHQGVLPNGLRYIIRPNAEPKGRVSLRLLIAAGSLHERDDEQGLAHFVEHMVFRGTRRHPNGSMTPELQRLGVGVGPENTAFTFFDHTIYHLELPDAHDATLRTGLSIFREYAEDVTFDPALIERERGVVLSEKDTRDTPEARVGDANLAFLWPDSREAHRKPIGLDALIRHFTRDQFVAFYDAWYRPERMAVIIVGDVKPEAAEHLVAEIFGPVRGRGAPRDEDFSPTPDAASKPNIVIFTDPGLVGASCAVQHPFADPRTADTHSHRVQLLHRALAVMMFQRRLSKAASDPAYISVNPLTSISNPFPGRGLASFGIAGKIANWQDVVTDIEREHRRALLYGFTQAELRSAKIAFATAYADAVRTSATWPSPWIADNLAGTLLAGSVIATPAALQQDLAAELAAATTAECRAAFRQAWTTQPPHVFVSTNPIFNVTAAELARAFNASREHEVAALPETGAVEFSYTDFGPPGTVKRDEHLADLDLDQAEFANGVRLNFKATLFEADAVDISLRVGRGKQSQPATQPGLDLLAAQLVTGGGLRRHPLEELRDLLSAHTVNVGFSVLSDAFNFTARCSRRDLLLCLQLIAAHLTDAAYRPVAMREIQASFGSMFASLAAAPGGPISVYAPRILAGGDSRFGLPSYDELSARAIPEVIAWVEPDFKRAPIELSIVGDTTLAEATDAVARTIAALPPRAPFASYHPSAGPRFPKPKRSMYAYTTAAQLRQVALAWFCPVTDLADMHQERRCRLLADLVTERLRVRLREELGATYNCSAQFSNYDGFPDFSYFTVYAEVAPGRAQQASHLLSTELASLQKKRFTDDEFDRVKLPFLRRREEDLRTNAYWCFTVLSDAQQRPMRLAAARDRSTDTAAITRRDLESLAKRYFDAKHYFQFVAYPAGASPAANLNFGAR